MYSIVLVTCPLDSANIISNTVLEKRVSSSINIISGVRSLYWWKEKIEATEEALLIMKTKTSLVDKLIRIVKKNHPYKIPSIISISISNGNNEYLEWLSKETTQNVKSHSEYS